MRNNLVFSKGPNVERSFRMTEGISKPIGIVFTALCKFLVPEEITKISEGFKRSDFSSKALKEDVLRCNVPEHQVIKDHHYTQALSIAKKLFNSPHKYRPVHFNDTAQYPWTMNTSVELPFTKDKVLEDLVLSKFNMGLLPYTRKTMSTCFEYVYEKNRKIVHFIKEGLFKGDKYLYAFSAHARSHLVPVGKPDKIRLVFGVPKLLLQVEMMLLWPYFNWLRLGLSPIAWGYEIFNGGFYKLSLKYSNHSYRILTLLALDWKGFDKKAKFTIIDDVHQIWSENMIMSQGYIPSISNPSSVTNPKRIRNLWRFMSQAVKHTPIRINDGTEYKRLHSTIPSGLLQTQVLDSWINAIMIITCLSALGYTVSEELFLLVLGDDSLVGLRELIKEQDWNDFLIRFAEEAERRFGAELNLEKSKIANSLDGVTFLGYEYSNSIPKRDRCLLLAQLLHPERSWDIHKLASKAIGIAYASCGQDKVVYDVCKDVYNYCVQTCGATPNPEGSDWLKYMNISTTINVGRFPSFEELSSNLFTIRKDPDVDEAFWPSNFFKDTR